MFSSMNMHHLTLPRVNEKKIFVLHYLPLLIGILCAQKIAVGGEIYLGEILAVVYLFVNFRRLEIGRSIRPLLLLGIVWALCQLVSDQFNQIKMLDSVKGVGAPLVLISTIAALSMYHGRVIQRMPSFLLGVFLGFIPEFIFFPSLYFQGNPWKWGLGQLILGLFSIYFTFFIKRKNNLFLLIFVAFFLIIGVVNDSRSMAIFPLFAALAYILLRSRRSTSILNTFRGRFGIIKLTFVTFFLLLAINTAFTAIFTSAWVLEKLPQESASKFKMQAGGDYGILLGGRSEMLVSIDAFLTKPLLGHGSWAKDKAGYQNALASRLFELGYSDRDFSTDSSNLIPVHSYLMGALVWAGIGGGLFWLFTIRWLLVEFINNAQLLGFYFFNGIVVMVWNIMFSPFGASQRWSSAVFIASLYCYSSWISKNKLAK